MDSEVLELLKTWNCEELCYFFLIKKVAHVQLCSMSDEEIGDVVPDSHSLLRDRLKEYLYLYRKTLPIVILEITPHEESLENTQSSHSLDTVVLKENELEHENAGTVEEVVNTCYEKIGEGRDEEEGAITACHENLEQLRAYENHPKYTQIMKNTRLFKILNDKRCFWGNIILYRWAFYEDMFKLRKILCSIIIDTEFVETLNSSTPLYIPHKRFEEIAEDIQRLFTSESKTLYYEHGYLVKENKSKTAGKTKSAIRVNTTGLLYREYLLKRTALRKKAELLRLKPTIVEKNAPEEEVFDISCLMNEVVEPCDDTSVDAIKTTWVQSYGYRQANFEDKGLPLLNKLKVLKSSICPDLVAHDFKLKYDVENVLGQRLGEKWPSFSKSVIQHAISKCGLKESDVKALTRQVDSPEATEDQAVQFVELNYSNLSDVFKKANDLSLRDNNTQQVLAFLILPALLKHPFRASESSGKWKPKHHDMQLSFIRHIEDHEKCGELIQSVKATYESFDVTLPQPYIVCCGPINRLQCCHVIIDDLSYTFCNIINAVDFLYKAFFVLGMSYPCGSAHVWTFFQRHVYDMPTLRNCVAKRKSDELETELRKLGAKRRKQSQGLRQLKL